MTETKGLRRSSSAANPFGKILRKIAGLQRLATGSAGISPASI